MSAELNPLDLVGERKKPIPTMTLPSTLVSSFATMALAMTLSTSSENLDIFDRELPDAHQQLSIQLGKDLEMFTIFNELPIELRLKIWRLAFPAARKVNLCGDSRATTWEGDKLPAWKSMTVTQFINRESRAETLKHYVITASSAAWYRDRNTADRSLCFSPALDTIICTFGDSAEELSRTDHWLKQLNSKFPGEMKGIRSLEINKEETVDSLYSSIATHLINWPMEPVANPHTIHWGWNESTYIETIDTTDLGIFPEHQYYLLGSGGSILHFAGLEELRVSLKLSGSYWVYGHITNTERQEMERNAEVNVSNCLNQNKKLFITGKAPIVEVVSCKRAIKRWQAEHRRF